VVSHDPAAKIQQLHKAILLGFLAVTLALIFWSVVRAPAILAREDNPRLVEAELRLQRGRILDRRDTVLAETVSLAETDQPPDRLARVYPIPEIGPAVGYYSFRHGTAGVEESFDAVLRGDVDDWRTELVGRLLHRPQIGQAIRLTLDAQWQITADGLLGNQSGAVILLSLPEAEIRALVSHPSYNPNQLDEHFDELASEQRAPLLNRVTQGQYQPGRLLQPLILAAALERQLIELEDIVADPNRPVVVEENVVRCAGALPDLATWVDVLHHRCPAPMMDLAERLGSSGLNEIFTQFGLTAPPDLPLNTETPASETINDPLLASIGQENLTITPLQLSLAWAALATDGHIPTPRLVTAVEDETGNWQPAIGLQTEPRVAVSAQTAAAIRQVLPEHENILEHNVLVLSGPENSTNSWYMGMAPATLPRYLVVVVVEESDDILAAQRVGRAVLAAVSF
jgi:peptidoglycan glycosyltransferase